MNKKIVSCFCSLFITLFLFLLFCDRVYAISFTSDEVLIYYDGNFNIQSYETNHHTRRKWISNSKKDSSNYAYCASRGDTFGAGSNGYRENRSWSSARNCKYKIGNKIYENGDCSVILGFIINTALEQSGNPASRDGWMSAQGSIWDYLYDFAPGFRWDNYPSVTPWNNHKKISKIFSSAWKNYYDSTNGGDASLTSSVGQVNFNVDVGNAKFDYIPSGSSCSTSGSYVTNKISITNNEKKTIHVSILKQWDDVNICDSFGCNGDKNFDIMSGDTHYVWLETSKILGKGTENIINLDIKAEYSEKINVNKKSYDTIVYEPLKGSSVDESKQRMVIMKKKSNVGSSFNNHSTTKEFKIKQIPIKHLTCNDKNINNSSKKYLKSNTSNTPVSRICASGTNGEKEINEDKYKASFQDCTCTTVNIGKNISVGVILVETVVFRFGTLDLDVVYPGGGFGLDVDNKNGGTPTNYYSELTWYFADTDLSGNPYYYDSSLKTGNVASGSMKTTLENGVRDSLRKMIEVDNKVTINIKSLDSNDALNTDDYNTKLNVNYDKIDYNGHTFKVEDEHLDMNKAYFSEDGKVSYVVNSKYTLDGGNKYYVPLKYQSNKFPYSIDVSNLSLTGKFNFYYKAPCEMIVNDYIYDYTYRTIDVTAPFSKTNLATSANWAYWWNGNISNQNRIKLTYRDYPNNSTYDVRLSNDYISKILSYNKLYTNWDTVNDDGSNTFISGNYGFITIARGGNSGSYCEIGKFNDSCDK